MRQASHEHRRRAGIDGPQKQSDNGHGNGISHNVGHKPHQELEGDGSDDETVHKDLFADSLGRGREKEATECDASPETGRDVAHGRGISTTRVDQEGNHPTGDGHLGTLVGEDEGRSEKNNS